MHVLVVENCPNAGLTVERLRQALDEHGSTDVEVELQVVAPGTRPPESFAGSPTILLDGVDPFASVASGASDVACRVYQANVREQGAPSLNALRQAVSRRW